MNKPSRLSDVGSARHREKRSGPEIPPYFGGHGGFLVLALLIPIVFSTLAQAAGTAAPAMQLPGAVSVSPQGAATYAIPIALPPSTAGTAPRLSLSYNSDGRAGLLGVGWSLSGLSTISRCPRTTAQDSVHGTVNYDANDRFCLDGRRLIVINGGTYGADGSEYRTEIESFTKVIAHGTAGTGPAWFEVHLSSGETLEFGHTTDSQLLATGKTTARSWALDKLTDTKGNYFTVTYTNDTTNGQAYPTRIDYTGNTGASLATYNSVQFTYQTRPDIVPLYRAGSIVKTTVRLTDIKSYAGATAVADYQISYDASPATSRSRVTSIKLCNGAGTTCLPATSFTNTGSALAFGTTQTNPVTTSSISGGTSLFTGDWNGDGITDFMWWDKTTGNNRWFVSSVISGSLTFTQTTNPITPSRITGGTNLYFGDWDGNGITDVMWYDTSTGNNRWFKNNGSLGFTETTNPIAVANLTGGAIYFGDWNGDGITDVMWWSSSAGTNRWWVNNGALSFTLTGNPIAVANLTGGVIYFGDWNGDGITDVMWWSSSAGTNRWWVNSGALSFTLTGNPITTTKITAGTGLYFGDWNGDGITDVMWYQSSNGTNRWFTNNGALAFSEADNLVPTTKITNGTAISLGDWNADGITDLLWYDKSTGNNRWFVNSGGGSSFTETDNPVATTTLINGTGIFLGDYNGDGMTEVFWYDKTSGNNRFAYAARSRADLIATVTKGAGTTTSVTYSALSDNTVYTKDTTATYPMIDVQGSGFVVSHLDAPNGLGGNYSSNYTYSSGKMDVSGRGFLSFYQMKALDLQTNILQTTTFRQDYPFIGLVASKSTSLNNQTLSSITNTYSTTNLGGTRNFPFLTQSVQASNDLDGSAMPTVTSAYQYDSYGNRTQIAVSASDGTAKTTNNTYSNDTTRWYLGRLTNASVTSNFPATALGSPDNHSAIWGGFAWGGHSWGP